MVISDTSRKHMCNYMHLHCCYIVIIAYSNYVCMCICLYVRGILKVKTQRNYSILGYTSTALWTNVMQAYTRTEGYKVGSIRCFYM